MTTIALPDELSKALQARADDQHVSLEELVVRILSTTLADETVEAPAPEVVVGKIKATPPDPANFQPATESLAELLAQIPDDSDLDSEEWDQTWAEIEAEIKLTTRLNDLAEGRG